MTTLKIPGADWRSELRSPLVLALVVLLGLQLLLALGLNLGTPGITAVSPRTALLDFPREQVVRMRIDSPDGGVTLKRVDETHWVIADLDDFPAAPSKVEQLLDQLAALKRAPPIATSEEARRRFRLTDNGFERRLTLEGKDEPLATLLIGDSPGFRRVFARPAADPSVYDLNLALSDLSSRRDDWLDPGLLRLDHNQITRIAAGDWVLIREAETWRLDGTDRVVDQAAANTLATRLAGLGYRGVLGTADLPAYRQQEPALVLTIGLRDGNSRIYRISQAQDSTDFVLKDKARPYFFKLSSDDLDGLLNLSADRLTAAPDATENQP